MSDADETQILKKAQECVEYILKCVIAERKYVIKRADLHKTILKDHIRISKQVLKQTQKFLDRVFGFELIDLDGDDRAEKYGVRSVFEFEPEMYKKDARITGGQLMTQFIGDHADNETSDRSFADQLKYSMLMIALSLIFMNGNEIEAEVFWDSLKRLDINKEEKKNKYLGDVGKFFMTELVKEGYLEYEQVRGTDPPQFKFKWGQRSKLEVPKMNILEFVCEIYGGKDVCKPEDWLTQYKDACKPDLFNDGVAVPAQQMVNLNVDEANTTRATQAAQATQRPRRNLNH